MRVSARTVALPACVLALALVAGVFAMKAFASTETYCNSCTISDTPAVSATRAFTSNHSSTFQAKKQQIYYYDGFTVSGSVSSSTQVFGLNYTGQPSGFTATARCHLLNDGSVLATCWADY